MKRSLKIILCLVMLAAVALMSVSMKNYLELGNNLRELRTQLTESRNRWEGIAAEKEVLEDELYVKNLELKKTEQSMNDAVKKNEELRSEIESLKKDISDLQKKLNPDN